MSHARSPLDQLTATDARAWVRSLPDGAVSVDIEGTTLALHASQHL